MAQVPATTKPRRALLRLSAASFGPRWTRDHCTLQGSERAALERRLDARPGPVDQPSVVFLIPLVGRHQVGNWPEVEDRLADTLASFAAQTSTRWRAVICGQDAPAGIGTDARVRFLPFTQPVDGNDKWAKLDRLCRALPDQGVTAGYAMCFDADDLLNRNAVAEMVGRRDPNGYLVTRGLIRDARTGAIGQCAPQTLLHPGRKPFWKMCGSCAAFRFDFSTGQADAEFLAAVTAHEHRMFPYLAALSGRPLASLRQDAAMYIVNHGENFGTRRGRVGFKTRYVTRFPIDDAGRLAQIKADFPGR